MARGGGVIYVLFNDQASAPPAAITRDFRGIAASTVNAILDGQMETTVLRAYAVALVHDYAFRLMQIPDDLVLSGDALAFSRDDMRALYDAGRALGRDPDSWQRAPQPGQTIGAATIKALERLRR